MDPTWGMTDPIEIVGAARALGFDSVIVSPRESDPDWGVVRSIAAGGPTWVNGTFQPAQLSQANGAGAMGGIFHINEVLASMDDRP